MFQDCNNHCWWYLLSLSSHEACSENTRKNSWCFFMLIWSSSWCCWQQLARVSFPLWNVFTGCFQQTQDLGPYRRLPRVWTRWWCELWWSYKGVGVGVVWFWLVKAPLLLLKWAPFWGTLSIHGRVDPGTRWYSVSSLCSKKTDSVLTLDK